MINWRIKDLKASPYTTLYFWRTEIAVFRLAEFRFFSLSKK